MSETQNQNDEAKLKAEEYAKLLNEALSQGVNGAIIMFINRNKLASEKGLGSLDLHWVFAQHVAAEFSVVDENSPEALYKYPFKHSLKKEFDAAIIEANPMLSALYVTESKENLTALCRVIAAGVVLDFLEKHKKEVLKFYKGLRGK